MRMTISRSKVWTALAVGAFVAPAVLCAQDQASTPQDTPAGRTHMVRAGDTLWDLARTYLGDPFLWPEIYRLNTAVVEDPHWIYPGEELRVPGDGTIAAADEGVVSTNGPTTFAMGAAARREQPGGRAAAMGRTPRPLIRAGEYYAAPWVDRQGGPEDAGAIMDRADVAGIAQLRQSTRLQFGDRISITAPAARPAAEGARYLAYEVGPTLGAAGQLFIPTGIVMVERASPGATATARVVASYNEMELGDKLIPFDSVNFPTGVVPSAIEFGRMASVLWVMGENVLPSLQQYVIVDAGEQLGIRQGDQFTLMRKRATNERGVTTPEEPIAVATAVRVTPNATTAIIVGQMQPAIRTGVAARLTAKAP